MLYCISIWIMCDVCLPCIVRLGTDSPVLYPVDRTALRNEASHHQSLLQRVSHSHPTAGWDLNTAQHSTTLTELIRLGGEVADTARRVRMLKLSRTKLE